ncbi:MAG TPA: HAMP domain-containing sensor histidine kinase [Polyangiaceae bacterium]|jgi:signal transduction histidine kinase|nr:HAMP domain-containing sensor histidine kinase [Polyangiaceae bacterium]
MVTSNAGFSTPTSVVTSLPEASAWDGHSIPLSDISAPMAACTARGEVLGLTPPARAILQGVGISAQTLPFSLPEKLWTDLSMAPEGEAIEWHAAGPATGASLGCTRYAFGPERFIVLMREVSAKRRELSRRLHRQRLESTGRLAASIAHDVRTALASILYNADFLANAGPELAPRDLVETANEIHAASRRLETICAGLLGFAKLGPPVADEVALKDVVGRACSLVRPMYRERGHELKSQLAQEPLRVRGNAILLDQILVNLLVNAAEASQAPVHVVLECGLGPRAPDGAARVRISVTDDGPGVPPGLRESIFHPFFTTHSDGSGLGLTTAREAAQEMGGELALEPTERGARFVVLLLAGHGGERS